LTEREWLAIGYVIVVGGIFFGSLVCIWMYFRERL
jgi:hypothetical protein